MLVRRGLARRTALAICAALVSVGAWSSVGSGSQVEIAALPMSGQQGSDSGLPVEPEQGERFGVAAFSEASRTNSWRAGLGAELDEFGGPIFEIGGQPLDHFRPNLWERSEDRDGSDALTVAAIMVALNPNGETAWTDRDLARVIEDGKEGSRISLHEDSCGIDDADCYTYPNPIPPTVWLLASALLGLLGIGLRQRRSVGAQPAE